MTLRFVDAFRKPRYIRLRNSDLSKHAVIAGDTGSGKSTIIRQYLHYAQACGDTCVVLDSKQEFLPEFYDPTRKDKIICATDDRCVYWDFGAEVTHEADALSFTRALFPTPPPGSNEQKWFIDQAWRIAAYIVASEPAYIAAHYPSSRQRTLTCARLGHILAHPDELDKRVKGSEHEQTLSKNAAPQRSGILATLNQIGFALRMMPSDDDRAIRERFTVREWAQHRNGWLFLPNSADTRDALRPLQSAIVDIACRRIMSSATQNKRVWIVLDETDSLNTLPALHDAMTQMRSTGNILIIGIQNFSQLEDRYGRQSDTIFSQAYTKYLMATSEAKSAKSLETLVGEVEIRKYRENRSRHRKNDSHSGPEDVRKPLILASEIQGLPDLTGYFLQRPADDDPGLHIVKFGLTWERPIYKTQANVERKVPIMSQRADEDREAEIESEAKQQRDDILFAATRQYFVQKELARLFAEDARRQQAQTAAASTQSNDGATSPAQADPGKSLAPEPQRRPLIPPKNQQQLPLDGASA